MLAQFRSLTEVCLRFLQCCGQAVLSQLDRPLLCTSAHVEEQEQLEIPEAAMLMDQYAGQGLDFIVDTGQRVSDSNVDLDQFMSHPHKLVLAPYSCLPFLSRYTSFSTLFWLEWLIYM